MPIGYGVARRDRETKKARGPVVGDRTPARAKKRAAKLVPLDFDVAERQYTRTASGSPVRAFHRQWATDVLDRALEALRAEMGGRFDVLREYIVTPRAAGIKAAAAKLGFSESNVKVLLHRARKRVAETVEDAPRSTTK